METQSPHQGSGFWSRFPGFAQERQFQLNPEDDRFGNQVTLVSDTLSVPCDVERDSTHSNQILCYTRYANTPGQGSKVISRV